MAHEPKMQQTVEGHRGSLPMVSAPVSDGLGMILASNGKIEAVSQPSENQARERFAVGASIFEYFDASSAEALRACMRLSAEQGLPNTCWPVCTSTSREVVVYEVQVVSFGGASEKKFAVYWQHSNQSKVGTKAAPVQAPRCLRPDANKIIHDLNNLLTTIICFTGFLMEDLDASDPRRQDVCEVLEAAQDAGRLTKELLVSEPQDD